MPAYLAGSDGSDTLKGLGNADTLEGEDGADWLDGSAGIDTLTGGGGADLLVFTTALSATTNVDTLVGFGVADDRILLGSGVFAALPPGELTNGRFVVASAAQDAAYNIIYNSATGALLYDSDGTGPTAAIHFAQLDTGLALTHHDILVV